MHERRIPKGREDGFDLLPKDTSWEAICAVIDGKLNADIGTHRDPAIQQGYTDLVTDTDRLTKTTSTGFVDE